MKKIGIVGLGIMGRGMARNFILKGHVVYVWNRNFEVAQELQKEGALVASSPQEVCQKADIIFEVTANDFSSREVWTGENGILDGADNSKVLIASATLSIKWIDELIGLCKAKSLNFLDIPLTGGRIGAETGTLTLLCGGEESILQEIHPSLESIAKTILHFGPAGHGMRYKLILNFLQAAHVVAFGQAMQIAKDNDMNLEKVAEALVQRPGGVITEISKKAYFQKPDPITFSIEWITKDLTYAKEFAGSEYSILNAVLDRFKKAAEAGYANEDWARVNNLN